MCVTHVSPAAVYSDRISVHLERLGSMPEDCVRFYVAQLSSGLSFLHDKGIMHR
jgi:serine/threonine protein kinase